MTTFAKGAQVKQIVKPIEGEVAGFAVDQETGELQVLVTWTDEDGEHSRYFKQDEIESVA
jgi:hypothetical protein